MTESQKTFDTTLKALPSREQIRSRISENLKEREILRNMLKLVEKCQSASGSKEGKK